MSSFAYLLPLIIWLVTLIICVVCVFAAWRAMFSDRGRSKRRCPKCWYDLSYTEGMTCAECGHIAQSERELQRTRRRPTFAMFALLLCVVIVTVVTDQMNEQGLMRHVPTRMLIWLTPALGGMDGPVGQELDRRANSNQLSLAEWNRIIARCAQGGWFDEPPSDAWVRNYGNYITTWRGRFVGDAKLEQHVLDIPPRLEVRTREIWPEGVPVVVGVRLDDWWPVGMECRVRATPRVMDDAGAEMKPIVFYRAAESRFRPSPFSMFLPPMMYGSHEIVIDFEISRRRNDEAAGLVRAPFDGEPAAPPVEEDDWEVVAQRRVTLSTTIKGTLAQMMQPASSAALDDAIAQAFGNAVKWRGGRSPVRFGINTPITFAPEFDDTAIGVSVELEREGVVARRLNLWWIAGTKSRDDGRNYGFEINYENPDLLATLNGDEAGDWILRVRSDPLLALRAGTPMKFWSGEITVPINLRENSTNAPPRLWWTEDDRAQSDQDDDATR